MTSLSVSSSIASSSLSATQVQMSVTASNIANADTDGYTTKSASTSTVSGGGVTVDTVSSSVSKLLLSQLVSATSDSSAADAMADYTDQLQTLMGSTTGDDDTGSSIANTLADVETAFSELATDPDSESLASAALSALDTLTSQLNDTSSEIQDLREDADDAISDAVDAANTLLYTIDDLNDQIKAANARGESTADLEDDLNSAILELSNYLGVTSTTNDDGSATVYTTSGQVLVGSTVHELEFTASSTITSSTVYENDDGSSGTLSGISVDGVDITDDISTGSISAYVTLRDETLPEVQDELDELASTLIDSLNSLMEESGSDTDLLTGSSASDIAVNEDLLSSPEDLLDVDDPTSLTSNLYDAFSASTSFDAAGSLGETETTFADYAEDILQHVVNVATTATTNQENAETELDTVTSAFSSAYGVNVDEETARLTDLENLYAVSSQILSTIQEMFDDLLAAVQ